MTSRERQVAVAFAAAWFYRSESDWYAAPVWSAL